MFRDPVSAKERILKVLYQWRSESTSESVFMDDLSAKTGLGASEVQGVIEDLLGLGYVKVATPAPEVQAFTWVKITKAGRDFLREKALVG